MDETELNIREEIIRTGIRMNELDINQGTSGNISVRWKEGILLTPTGIPYEELQPEDICHQSWNGMVEGKLEISSEWRFHLAIQKNRKDVNTIVHTHSNHATALAIQEMEIPAIHYMVAAGGGPNIRCAPYATFGTEELSKNVIKALENRSACLMSNHGQVAFGKNLEDAFELAQEIENICHQYTIALKLGQPKILSFEEMKKVLDKAKNYKKG